MGEIILGLAYMMRLKKELRFVAFDDFDADKAVAVQEKFERNV